jgi:hypothetical protein
VVVVTKVLMRSFAEPVANLVFVERPSGGKPVEIGLELTRESRIRFAASGIPEDVFSNGVSDDRARGDGLVNGRR